MPALQNFLCSPADCLQAGGGIFTAASSVGLCKHERRAETPECCSACPNFIPVSGVCTAVPLTGGRGCGWCRQIETSRSSSGEGAPLWEGAGLNGVRLFPLLLLESWETQCSSPDGTSRSLHSSCHSLTLHYPPFV